MCSVRKLKVCTWTCSLDTMGYVEVVTQKNHCPHACLCGAAIVTVTISCGFYILFSNLEVMTKIILYQTLFSDNQWQKGLDAFPKKVPTAGGHSSTEAKQIYLVNIRKTAQNAKCASCKTKICKNNVQSTTQDLD